MIIYKPLFLFLLYFSFTITLYFFGPVDYVRKNSLELIFLLFFYKSLFILGYVNSSSINRKKVLTNTCDEITYRYKELIFPFFLLLYLLLNLYVYNGVRDFSLSSLFSQIVLAINSPLDAYSDSFVNEGRSSSLIMVIVLFSPLYYYLLVKSIFCFSNLSIVIKSLLILVFFLEAYKWIALGRNKGVFDLVILISLIVYSKGMYIKINQANTELLKSRMKKIFILILSSVLLLAALAYFDNALSARKAAYADYDRFNDTLIMSIAPDFLKSFLVNITIYLAEGYRALSLIIDLDWDPMYGVGHSSILINKFSNLLDLPLFDNTYQTKLYIFGIDPRVNWHSAYVWFANDVHWLGVGIIMYLIGYFFAYFWVSFLSNGNTLDLTLFALFVLMLFYLPGNTQLFNQTATLFTFWALLLYKFFVSRIKVSIK